MKRLKSGISRREYLLATGAGIVAAQVGSFGSAFAATPVRQGYQTNMWGMPTYYLVQSGLLEKHGLEVEEFPVPGQTGQLPDAQFGPHRFCLDSVPRYGS